MAPKTADDNGGSSYDIGSGVGSFAFEAPESAEYQVLASGDHPGEDVSFVRQESSTKERAETAPFKYVAELRPTDVFFLTKTRGATLMASWDKGTGTKREMQAFRVGSDITRSAEFQKELTRAAHSKFPKGAQNRAVEVIY